MGHEDLARQALQRKETLMSQVNGYKTQMAQLQAQDQQILRACIQPIEAIEQLLLQCREPFIGSGQDAIGCASDHGWLITLT